MSDRCWLTLAVSPEQEKIVTSKLGKPDVCERPGVEGKVPQVLLTYEEANYGFHRELGELAEAGVVLYGEHTRGRDYSARRFCTIDGVRHEHPCTDENELYVVVSEDGQVSDNDLAAARGFIERENRVLALLNLGTALARS